MIQLKLNGKNYSLSSGKKIYFKQEAGGSAVSNFSQVKNIYYGEGKNPHYVKVYQYDNAIPTIEIKTPLNGSYITSVSNISVTGSVSDADSGIDKVLIGDIEATLSNTVKNGSGKIESCDFKGTISASDFYVTVIDNANNKVVRRVILTKESWNSVSRGSSTPAPGDVAYTEWCRCNICGRQGSARKWRNTGGNVYDNPDTLFSVCPNNHYHYKVTIKEEE